MREWWLDRSVKNFILSSFPIQILLPDGKEEEERKAHFIKIAAS